MKHLGKKVFILILLISLLMPSFSLNHQVVYAQTDLNLEAKAAILVDAGSGKILYSENADQALPPASMTKMMTEYLILEAINTGKIKWEDTVTASEYAHWMGVYGGSRVFLAHGEKRTVKELMNAMAIYSANDATVALAEHLAGTEANFVKLMNEKAQEFGMTQTYYVTSTGYPADELEQYSPQVDGDNMISARDSAILAWHLINDYPEIFEYTSTPYLTFRQGEPDQLSNLPNWNWMLPGVVKTYEYFGVDGLKTGHTDQAGYNFTGTAKRDDTRLITVVMGTSSEGKRFDDTKKLLDYGFTNYHTYELVGPKEAIAGFETIPVEKGKEKEVAVISKNSLNVLVKKGEEDLYKPMIQVEKAVAPIKSGDKLGLVIYEYSGQEKYDFLNEEIKALANVELIAEDDAKKASAFRLFFRKIGSIFSGIYNGIVN